MLARLKFLVSLRFGRNIARRANIVTCGDTLGRSTSTLLEWSYLQKESESSKLQQYYNLYWIKYKKCEEYVIRSYKGFTNSSAEFVKKPHREWVSVESPSSSRSLWQLPADILVINLWYFVINLSWMYCIFNKILQISLKFSCRYILGRKLVPK